MGIKNNLDHTRRIHLKDYARTRDGKIVIEYDLIKRFLELLERTFQMEGGMHSGTEQRPKTD